MNWLSFGLILVALLMLLWLLLQVREMKSRRVELKSRERLRNIAARVEKQHEIERQGGIVREEDEGLLEDLFSGLPIYEESKLKVSRAGFECGAGRFYLLSIILGTLAGLFGKFVLLSHVAAVVLAVSLAGTPWLIVAYLERRRRIAFDAMLPQALELICRSLRAGHALTAGLRMVRDELSGPLGIEFGRIFDEISMGLDVRVALDNLQRRVASENLTFFSTAIVIQRETGGNLAEIMDRLGWVVRERHKFHGKVKALTAQNRGAALILLATPFTFVGLMYTTDRSFVEPLWLTPTGNIIGLVCSCMTIVGYLLARRLAVVTE